MEVLFDIYNDAYRTAINSGATESEAKEYAELFTADVTMSTTQRIPFSQLTWEMPFA